MDRNSPHLELKFKFELNVLCVVCATVRFWGVSRKTIGQFRAVATGQRMRGKVEANHHNQRKRGPSSSSFPSAALLHRQHFPTGKKGRRAISSTRIRGKLTLEKEIAIPPSFRQEI